MGRPRDKAEKQIRKDTQNRIARARLEYCEAQSYNKDEAIINVKKL
jgi:hypothetical protein